MYFTSGGKRRNAGNEGRGILADVLKKRSGDYQIAFDAYNQGLRSFVKEVQAEAKENVTKYLVSRRQEVIRERKEGELLERSTRMARIKEWFQRVVAAQVSFLALPATD